jgi:hypothetical protein
LHVRFSVCQRGSDSYGFDVQKAMSFAFVAAST